MRTRRIVTATALTALTVAGVAACGTQSLKDYAQGTWSCSYIDHSEGGTAESFTFKVGDGTWVVTESSWNYMDTEEGTSGTWTLGPGGATITNDDGDEYSGAMGYPEDATDGTSDLDWDDRPMTLTIAGKKVTIDYSETYGRMTTTCTKA